MSARVFIGHRRGEGAGLASALADELDAVFGDGQVVRLVAGAPSEAAWREALAGTRGAVPILLLLVASDPTAAPAENTDMQGAQPDAEDPLRALLDAGLAAGALVRPVLAGSVAALAAADDLPLPFEKASRLPRRPLRAVEWTGDVARLAEDLRELGVRPLAGTQPGTMPVPLPAEGPTTTPMPLDEGGSELAAAADGGRRGLLGMATVALLLVGGWGVWRWQQRRAANLTGIWRARIGLRDAPTSREGGLMLVTLSQKDRSVGLVSTVGIENDPQWEAVRDAWKERTGGELKQLVYRGEGEFIDEGESASGAASAPAAEPSDAASAAPPTKADAERARRIDPTLGMRRVVIAVRIAAPGTSGEKIDEGVFRGVVDISDQRIHGRLWLESEQAERVVDLRRGD